MFYSLKFIFTNKIYKIIFYFKKMFLTKFLCGVPKWKTPKPKKQTRKFSSTRVMRPAQNLVNCSACSSVHHISTICLNCYETIRFETNEIKRTMMKYNPYIGERQKQFSKSDEKINK